MRLFGQEGNSESHHRCQKGSETREKRCSALATDAINGSGYYPLVVQQTQFSTSRTGGH